MLTKWRIALLARLRWPGKNAASQIPIMCTGRRATGVSEESKTGTEAVLSFWRVLVCLQWHQLSGQGWKRRIRHGALLLVFYSTWAAAVKMLLLSGCIIPFQLDLNTKYLLIYTPEKIPWRKLETLLNISLCNECGGSTRCSSPRTAAFSVTQWLFYKLRTEFRSIPKHLNLDAVMYGRPHYYRQWKFGQYGQRSLWKNLVNQVFDVYLIGLWIPWLYWLDFHWL